MPSYKVYGLSGNILGRIYAESEKDACDLVQKKYRWAEVTAAVADSTLLPKYELTEDFEKIGDSDKRKAWRIRALRDFADVKKGDLGGFVEDQRNLSHEGNCWIYDDADAIDFALVSGNAQIRNHAQIYGNAVVTGNAKILDYAEVYCHGVVTDNAVVKENAKIWGAARIIEDLVVSGKASLCPNDTLPNGDLRGSGQSPPKAKKIRPHTTRIHVIRDKKKSQQRKKGTPS